MPEIIAPKSEAVLIETREETAVIAPQQEAVVVEVRTEIAVIAPKPEAVVIETGQQGPAGPAGHTPGGGTLPDGTNTGDIVRFNAATGDWESCAEPFDFHGIILIPMVLPGSPVEGFIGYNAADNGLYVAVE